MKKNSKKMIAPIIIAACVIIYYVGIAVLFGMEKEIPLVAKALMILIPLSLVGVMIGVLISRIKEIRSGEEDDLGKY